MKNRTTLMPSHRDIVANAGLAVAAVIMDHRVSVCTVIRDLEDLRETMDFAMEILVNKGIGGNNDGFGRIKGVGKGHAASRHPKYLEKSLREIGGGRSSGHARSGGATRDS